MAILIDVANGRKTLLRPQHVFGRDRIATTVLDSSDASRLHASIRWSGEAWELRDHSRNGTLVDGQRVPDGAAVILRVGQSLVFGRDAAWHVGDVDRPRPLLWPLDGGEPFVLARANLLPGGADSTLSITQSIDGRWLSTGPQGSQWLEDGDDVLLDGARWCFRSGAETTFTQECDADALALVQRAPSLLHFAVSLDEEHVQLQLTHAHRTVDLGERTHHYALLTLARLRMDDASRGVEASAQGWIEQGRLARMLGLEPGHLNIQVFRLRKQTMLAFGNDVLLPELVERRRGELRLGDLAVRVMRGTRLQASFDPRCDTSLALETAHAG